jgi:hypothetical protein
MSRASSSRLASESRKARMVCAEMATRPLRSPPRIAAIGASKVGARAARGAGSARRKLLTQETSGNSRMTRWNESTMPMRRTPTINPLSHGLAMNALRI